MGPFAQPLSYARDHHVFAVGWGNCCRRLQVTLGRSRDLGDPRGFDTICHLELGGHDSDGHH